MFFCRTGTNMFRKMIVTGWSLYASTALSASGARDSGPGKTLVLERAVTLTAQAEAGAGGAPGGTSFDHVYPFAGSQARN